jgi:hypothetical protein
MAYTPPIFRGDPAAGQTGSSFSGLRTDGNRVAMTGVLGNWMQTQDNTGTPVTSPVTVNTTKTLVVPNQAAQITISPVTNPVQVSEDSTQTAYFAIPAGQTLTFDCANMTNIYLKTSGSTVVSFLFNMV